MIRSMTGYGRKVGERGGLRLTVEMRSVNHRFCEIVVRLPKQWGAWEDKVRKLVAERVRRGRVEVTLSVEPVASRSPGFTVNWEAVERYVELAGQFAERFSVHEPLRFQDIFSLPGVIEPEQEAAEPGEDADGWIADVVSEAADELLAMKQTEGETLYRDLEQRMGRVKAWTEEISQLAAEAVQSYRARLTQRLREWSEELQFDEQRVSQEVVLFAERADISEETTRLLSHFDQFAEQMKSDETVGRKLDFLLQEMNREINTIGSKANYLPIQRLAVEVKTELEKMREQVQNIE